MNLPNKLTVLRMAMVPFFVVFLLYDLTPHHYLIAGLLFGAAAYTDRLDGQIARSRGLVTNFGKLMDPLADKIMVISALCCLTMLGYVNIWFLLVIIAREFLVTSVRLIAVENGRVIAANIWGKVKTVSQIIAILLIIAMQYFLQLCTGGILPVPPTVTALLTAVFWWVGQAAAGITAVFTVLSGLTYLLQNRDVLRS